MTDLLISEVGPTRRLGSHLCAISYTRPDRCAAVGSGLLEAGMKHVSDNQLPSQL